MNVLWKLIIYIKSFKYIDYSKKLDLVNMK